MDCRKYSGWENNSKTFKLLSNKQIKVMENDMIQRNLKINRKNIKEVARRHSIPINRAVSYFESLKFPYTNEESLPSEMLLQEIDSIILEIDIIGTAYSEKRKKV